MDKLTLFSKFKIESKVLNLSLNILTLTFNFIPDGTSSRVL